MRDDRAFESIPHDVIPDKFAALFLLKTIKYTFVNNLIVVAVKYLEKPIVIRPLNWAEVFDFCNRHF